MSAGAVTAHVDSDELVRRAVAGDDLALSQLLVRHHGRFKAQIRARLPANRHISPEDVLQEAMVDMFKSIGGLATPTEAGFVAWSRQVVKNRIAQSRRHLLAARRGANHRTVALADVEQFAAGLIRQSRSPRSWLAGKESVELLRGWLAELDPLPKSVLHLRFVEGLDYLQIAGRLGRRPGAVRMISMRALRQLRQAMDDSD
jgi:RNA polymerase sigma factor (sigma-70 family)